MFVYKCYECNKVLCKDCSRKHDNETKYRKHSVQLISDSFILNCKFHVDVSLVNDIQCLPNGDVSVAAYQDLEVKTFSVSGTRRHVIHLEYFPWKITVVDKNTVAVLLIDGGFAIVDIQQNHVQYIQNIAIPFRSNTLIYIENEFYISDKHGIVVIDMSGSVKRRFALSFVPYNMCYDSQHIYCIDSENSQLICIDRDGNDIFTFTDPNMKKLNDLTIDNEGNALVLCRKEDVISKYSVIKVDSNGEKSEVVITNINTSSFDYPRICYDHLTNSVFIGLDDTVYIYKKK